MTKMVRGWRKQPQSNTRDEWQRQRQREFDQARERVKQARRQMDRLAKDVAETWWALYATPKTTNPRDPYATLIISDGEWLREIVNLLDQSAWNAQTWLHHTTNVPQLVADMTRMGIAAPTTRRLTDAD